MNPEVKTKWVEALRSGEYQQSQAKLRTKYGFCCLGVLCDLYQQENPDKSAWVKEGGYERFKFIAGISSDTHLPPVVVVWAGLADNSPMVSDEEGNSIYLTEENDFRGDFKKIATLIENSL